MSSPHITMALYSLQGIFSLLSYLIFLAASLGLGELLLVIIIVIPISQIRKLRCGEKGVFPVTGQYVAESYLNACFPDSNLLRFS